MTDTHVITMPTLEDSPIKRTRVGARPKTFEARLRKGYFYGSGQTIQEGPCDVLIPVDPDPKTGHVGLRGYLHMLDNEAEARELLNMPGHTFLSARDAATEAGRIIAQANAGAKGRASDAHDVSAIVAKVLESALPAIVGAIAKPVGEAVGQAIAEAMAAAAKPADLVPKKR